jgi:predicted permease
MLAVAAVIVAGLGAGVWTAHHRDDATRLAERVLWLALWVILPIVTFFNFARFEPTAEIGVGIAFAYVALATALGIAYVAAHRLGLEGHTRGAFICAAFLANTGFLGLPFTAALLGFDALPAAITYDQLVSAPWLLVVAFSIGAAYRHEQHVAIGGIRAFLLRNPALYALAAGLAAPDALAPEWAVDVANGLVVAMAPLGFFALGVFATGDGDRVRFPPPMTREVAAVSAIKLSVPVTVMGVLAWLVHDVPDAYLVQAAMPTGLNSLLLVSAYRLDREMIAGAILYTTTVVLAWGIVAAALE